MKPKSQGCPCTCTVDATRFDVGILWSASAFAKHWWLSPRYYCGKCPCSKFCALDHICGMCQTVPSIVGCVLPLLWNVVCFTKYCGICPGSKHCGMRLTFNVGCVKHYQALWGACYHYCGMLFALPSIVGCVLVPSIVDCA